MKKEREEELRDELICIPSDAAKMLLEALDAVAALRQERDEWKQQAHSQATRAENYAGIQQRAEKAEAQLLKVGQGLLDDIVASCSDAERLRLIEQVELAEAEVKRLRAIVAIEPACFVCRETICDPVCERCSRD